MLAELIVEGLGVIDRAELQLSPGSIALTGETGAGKTLVVAAVGLLLGERAGRALVRTGREEARVEGRFVVPADHPAVAALQEAGLSEGGDEPYEDIVVARSIAADGRSGRVRINGRLATATLLSEVMGALVEVTGQHEQVRVGTPAFQRSLLDAVAGPEAVDLAATVAAEVRAAGRAKRAAEESAARERERGRQIDVLRYEIAEIEAADVRVGEWELLGQQARRLEHAEGIATAVASAADALRGEPGAEDLVARAETALRTVSGVDPELEALAARLEAVAYELADVAAELSGRIVEPDPQALDEVRARRAVLGRLRRKYGGDDAEIRAYLDRSKARLAAFESEEAGGADLAAAAQEHGERAALAAARLSELRAAAALRLGHAVEKTLANLAMPGCRFEVLLEPRPLYEGGAEAVEFLVSSNPTEAPRPLAKAASGGELARIALALHLLTTSASARTMVFDEVDAGVGGRAAQAVGRALARLARDSGAQVIVVTHLPQVAAHADGHYRVAKTAGGATVERVEGDERVRELSRMLAGLPESERAREHAEELLQMAASEAGRC